MFTKAMQQQLYRNPGPFRPFQNVTNNSIGNFSHSSKPIPSANSKFNPLRKPYIVYSADLPLFKEVVVEVVETPYNFIEKEGELSFFVRIKNYVDDRYSQMQRELNNYVTSKLPDANNPKDGEFVIVAAKKNGYRARVFYSNGERFFYLLDYGKTCTADEMWCVDKSSLPEKSFLNLPGVVIQCQLEGVTYKDQASMEKVRRIIEGFQDNRNGQYKLTNLGYNGKASLVKMRVQYDNNSSEGHDFISDLTKLGLVTFNERNADATYTKAELMAIKGSPCVCQMQIPVPLRQFEHFDAIKAPYLENTPVTYERFELLSIKDSVEVQGIGIPAELRQFQDYEAIRARV